MARASTRPRSEYKLVVLGESAVGKTSIISRFLHGTFDPSYRATIGIDFVSKLVQLEDRCVRLQMWDTAGAERFQSLTPSYVRDSAAAIVVYDVTNLSSFRSVRGWIALAAEARADVLIVIVGNKTDLAARREVSTQEGADEARRFSTMFVETSAKAGSNVPGLFHTIARTLASETASGSAAAAAAERPAPLIVRLPLVPEVPAADARQSWCGSC